MLGRCSCPCPTDRATPSATSAKQLAVIAGVERKVHYFVLDLPHSDGCFAKAYPGETTEAFLDGHVSAFAFLGGVPQSVLYDNTKLAVAKILGDGRRKRTRAFSELQSHYLFEDRFGRPGKGNDKGKVEGMVGYVRRNFLVPIPVAESFEALNAHLEARCMDRMDAVTAEDTPRPSASGWSETWTRCCRCHRCPTTPATSRPAGVSSLSLVRYRTNDYSVPVAYGHREVLIKGYVDRVVISCGTEVIAQHPQVLRAGRLRLRSHSLPAVVGAGRRGLWTRPRRWRGGDLPEEYRTLRHLMEDRMGQRGKREFVRVLRLMEHFSHQEVHHAVRDALRLGAVGFDAVKHLLLCRVEGKPPRLDLELYPHLPRVSVQTTRATDYLTLLSGRAA